MYKVKERDGYLLPILCACRKKTIQNSLRCFLLRKRPGFQRREAFGRCPQTAKLPCLTWRRKGEFFDLMGRKRGKPSPGVFLKCDKCTFSIGRRMDTCYPSFFVSNILFREFRNRLNVSFVVYKIA